MQITESFETLKIISIPKEHKVENFIHVQLANPNPSPSLFHTFERKMLKVEEITINNNHSTWNMHLDLKNNRAYRIVTFETKASAIFDSYIIKSNINRFKYFCFS